MDRFLNQLWYGKKKGAWLLWPFAWVYRLAVFCRKKFLLREQQHFSVPIIVVGNISVGGVGKTPLVIELAQFFKRRNLRVGIVTRGYRSTINHYPYHVKIDDAVSLVGDEPLLLARRSGCPVIIAPKRAQAVRCLIEQHKVQIIISDDGLQHYRMGRSIEIAVVDGMRGLGNQLCLPAGPLREPPNRLAEVDFIVINNSTLNTSRQPDCRQKISFIENHANVYAMHFHVGEIAPLLPDCKPVSLEALSHNCAAIAGIGNPERFFKTLTDLNITHRPYCYPDHHWFTPCDFEKLREKYVIMTEKDAVKCFDFAPKNSYFLPITAKIDPGFWDVFTSHPVLLRYFK